MSLICLFLYPPPLLGCPFAFVRRRASTYLVVLAVALIVATMGLGALLAVRAQLRAASSLADAAEARWYALSAVELGRMWINKDPAWRTNRTTGLWASEQPLGSGSFTLEVTDPVDGDLANRPHDPVIFKATGIKGSCRQMLEVTLSAAPQALPALSFALHTGGQLHILAGNRLAIDPATVSTNGSLRNDGMIQGNVEASSASAIGTVTGSVVLNAPPKVFPDPSVIDLYANLATQINPGNLMERQVLGPERNPWGTPNPEGVYVIRTSSDLTIKKTRIWGTLVVICPGKKVVLDEEVLLQPYRTDYPTLVVQGDAVFQYTGLSAPLSEPMAGVNFNPADAPYEGESDEDIADLYPNQIEGLVHVTGKLQIKQGVLVRGLILCESTLSTDAVACQDAQIVYSPALYASPPQGYTTTVKMIPQSGSWHQVVQ
ncbi:MAG: hypothetical protein ACUVUC_05225 [Thermoguttaceae bacterium]